MNGHTGDAHPGRQGLALRVEPPERREQRRVHIEHRYGYALEKIGTEKTHEAAEGHEIGAVAPSGVQER